MIVNLLGVYLEDGKSSTRVGALVRNNHDLISLLVDQEYIALGPTRPILSSGFLSFGDDRATIDRLRGSNLLMGGRNLPPFFANLLPEGALRALVESNMPAGRTSDLDILQWVGGDLPGAVVVRREDGSAPLNLPEQKPDDGGKGPRIRFSLAGVQMKLSMLKKDESLTFPATGTNGNIIAKLPSAKIPHLPEVEFTSMELARACGILVPRFELVPTADVSGIPEELLDAGDSVFAVDRFDRPASGGRIHMEDFAQILGAYGDQKYRMANDETVMKLATSLGGGGTKPFLEAARRVAVNILMGNTDAHLKNWSLWYPNPAEGQLSPAYDIVAYNVYDHSDEMALSFRGTRNSRIMNLARFKRAASLVGVTEARVSKEIKTTVEIACDTWPSLLPSLPMPRKYSAHLLDRTRELALVQEFRAGHGNVWVNDKHKNI